MKPEIPEVCVENENETTTGTSHKTKMIKTSCLIAFLATIFVVIVFLPVKQILLEGATWIQEQGFLGYICFILAFIVQICLGIPSTFFEAMSGFIFGFWKAMIITTLGKTSGCMLAFTIGGVLGKDTLGAYMNRKFTAFKAMSKVFANADYKLLCMFQLAYIPILFKCFGLSIMDVKPFKFFITTLICGIPYTAFWSYLGSQSHDLLKVLSGEEVPEGGPSAIFPEKLVFVGVGVISGIVAMFLLAKYSREQLHLIRENNRLSEEAMETSKSVVVPDPSHFNLK